MAGNRQIYDQAMNMGHSAAWDQLWDKAIAAYGRAVQEFPEDPAAHNSLGLALLQARRLEDALKVYTRAHQLAPDDPIPLEKSADVLERLGRLKEAAQQYVNVAEVYLAQRDLEKAIGNWERATRLTSGLVQIHQRLALAYERTGQRKNAIREYLTLAANFQRGKRTDIATQAVERALRIDPKNPQALNTLAALQAGAQIVIEDLDDRPAQTVQDGAFAGKSAQDEPARAIGESDPRGPIGEAMERALAALANYVFDTGQLDQGRSQTIQGMEYQRQELIIEAVGAYERAVAAKVAHPGVRLNLGVLQLDMERWKDAIKTLEKAAEDSTLASGAWHGIALAYTMLKNPRATAHALIEALRAADLELAVTPDEASQINVLYDNLNANVDQTDEQQIRAMNLKFLELLTGSSWKQRVVETRRQIQEMVRQQGGTAGIIPILPYINERITEGMSLIAQYAREGLYTLAMDQAHYLLESAPSYLEIHHRIGDVLLERGSIQLAIDKYDLIAKTHLVRGETDQARHLLNEALRIAPMDTGLHESLIDLLQREERWDDVLDQYIDLADAYYQLADLDAARRSCQAALQLAQRINAPTDKMITILHRVGDIDVNRLDVRQAMRTYEQIRKLSPDDERARRALVDLNYRVNDAVSAVRELDGLLRIYAKEQRAGQIIKVLEELVLRYPKDMALRSRLAAVYRQMGQVNKAIEQLDTLAELQLESGLHDDAIVTIRRIIALNPARIEDYKQLLRQLSG